MICQLCWNFDENSIEIASEEGIEQSVAAVVYKYFRFCFENYPDSGRICRKCWLKVDLFHKFYVHIEEIHNSLHQAESIFVANEPKIEYACEILNNYQDQQLDQKIVTAMSNDHNDEQRSEKIRPKSPPVNDINTANEISSETKRKRGRPRKTDSIENVVLEVVNVGDIKNEPKRERGRPRKTDRIENLDFDDDFVFTAKPAVDKPHSSKKATKAKLNKMKKQTLKKERKKLESQIFKSHPCEICHHYFLTEHKLQRHQKQTHFALPFKCKFYHCVESFDTTEQLDAHNTKDHARTECPQCGKIITASRLEHHIKLVHDTDQRVVCDLCGKVSSNKNLHKKHIQVEHEVQQKLQCDICKQWFKSRETIRTHMSMVHVEEPQTCPICGRVSPNRKALRDHQKIHLEGTKERFKCIVCGKGFRQSNKLKDHSNIHTGVTDAYECNFCGKTFRFGSSWSAHRMKEHPAEMEAVKVRLQRKKNMEFKV